MDLVEGLIDAWLDWEDRPGSRPACVAKHAAIAALRLDGSWTHEQIAGWRRAGYSVSDACQSVVNDTNGRPGATSMTCGNRSAPATDCSGPGAWPTPTWEESTVTNDRPAGDAVPARTVASVV